MAKSDQADIFQVDGIGDRYAGLLNATGVDSLIKLAGSTPRSLHQHMAQRNAAFKLVKKLPSQSLVGKWVNQARYLTGEQGLLADELPGEIGIGDQV